MDFIELGVYAQVKSAFEGRRRPRRRLAIDDCDCRRRRQVEACARRFVVCFALFTRGHRTRERLQDQQYANARCGRRLDNE